MQTDIFTARLVAAASLAVICAGTASAHRLDEYLQATLIGLTRDGVDLEINLTPGVAVLPAVMSAIDKNLDGRISPAEERAYADQVVRDVELQLDGKPVPLRLIGTTFPEVEAMRDGLGTIRLKLHANSAGRQLRFENRHMRAVSVYLVNCLASPNDGLLVGRQDRDQAQQSIRFPYSFADVPRNRPDPGWFARVAFCVVVAGSLFAARVIFRHFEVRPGG
jgi:hypothetical protein